MLFVKGKSPIYFSDFPKTPFQGFVSVFGHKYGFIFMDKRFVKYSETKPWIPLKLEFILNISFFREKNIFRNDHVVYFITQIQVLPSSSGSATSPNPRIHRLLTWTFSKNRSVLFAKDHENNKPRGLLLKLPASDAAVPFQLYSKFQLVHKQFFLTKEEPHRTRGNILRNPRRRKRIIFFSVVGVPRRRRIKPGLWSRRRRNIIIRV